MTQTLGTLADLVPRNADPVPDRVWQKLLTRIRQRLVDTYGWRPERVPNEPAVPYLPVSLAERLLRLITRHARAWLIVGDVPRSALQPAFIQNKLADATRQLGRWEGSTLIINPAHVEPAPAAVAGRPTPSLTGSEPPGPPSTRVLRPVRTRQFLLRLKQLAIHFDVLSTQPTRGRLIAESLAESVAELPERIGDVAVGVANVATKTVRWLGPVLVIGAGALVLALVKS